MYACTCTHVYVCMCMCICVDSSTMCIHKLCYLLWSLCSFFVVFFFLLLRFLRVASEVVRLIKFCSVQLEIQQDTASLLDRLQSSVTKYVFL